MPNKEQVRAARHKKSRERLRQLHQQHLVTARMLGIPATFVEYCRKPTPYNMSALGYRINEIKNSRRSR